MIKKFFIFGFVLSLLLPISAANAQEWKRYQEFTNATGNQFAAPMREYKESKPSDSYTTMPCTSEPIHPMVVVTAAHCISGVYGDKGNAYAWNGGTVWIQEPGKRADDPTAKRVKVIQIFRPDVFNKSENFPTSSIDSQDDIAFLVLEEPLVKEVKHKVATLEQIKYAMDNGLKMRVYGYGLNSIAEQNAYYATPQNERYSVSNQLYPRKLEYSFVTEKLPTGYVHFVGFPKMVIAKLPTCGATGTSGSPAVIEIKGEEFLIGPGSHSTGWDCPELKDYNDFTAKNDPYYKYRNTFSHIIIANYVDLMHKAIQVADKLMPKNETVNAESSTIISKPAASSTVTQSPTDKNPTVTTIRTKITIKCIKGSKVMYATSYNPRCPKGYSASKN